MEDASGDVCSELDAAVAATRSEADLILTAVIDRLMVEDPELRLERDAAVILYVGASTDCPEHEPLILQFMATHDQAETPGWLTPSG